MQKVEFDVKDQMPLQIAYKNIMNEISEDLILQFCYRMHRAVKLENLFIDLNTIENESEENDFKGLEVDIYQHMKGSKTKCSYINCPRCTQKLDATRFAPHLEKCMGMGRKSSRNASKKFTMDAFNSDCDDYDNESDGASRKRTKKKPSRKNPPKMQKFTNKNGEAVSISSESFSNLEEMRMEDRERFLSMNCGAKSKHKKKYCMKTLKCKQHTKKEKDEVRNLYLPQDRCVAKEPKEEIVEDIQIDVDTVEEDSNRYSEADLSRSPSLSENSPMSNSHYC